jgi:hypothetical protein
MPDPVIEIGDLAAEFLRFGRTLRRQDVGASWFIAKKTGFFRHHEVFGRGVANPFDFKGMPLPPLAETRFGDGTLSGRGVAPEEGPIRDETGLNFGDEGFTCRERFG